MTLLRRQYARSPAAGWGCAEAVAGWRDSASPRGGMIAAGADLGADRGGMSHSAQGAGASVSASASARGSGTKCQCLRVSARHDEMGQTITGRVVAAWGTATSIDIYVKVWLCIQSRDPSVAMAWCMQRTQPQHSQTRSVTLGKHPHTNASAVRLQCTLTLCTPRGYPAS